MAWNVISFGSLNVKQTRAKAEEREKSETRQSKQGTHRQ
jgi:hypothetical protein